MQTTRKTPEQTAAERGVDLGYELTSGFAANLIRRKAKQLAKKKCFRTLDPEDIAQELNMHLIRLAPKFNPDVSHWNAFVSTVVDRQVANMLEATQMQRRVDDQHVDSLSTPMPSDDGDVTTLAQLVRSDESTSKRFTDELSPEEHFALCDELENVLAELPSELRDLAERLKHDTIAQIARDLDIPRTTLYRQIDELRSALRESSLNNL